MEDGQLIINGSFETYDGPHGGGAGTGWYENPNSIDGWTYNNVDVHEAGHNNFGATDGGHHLDLAARTNGWISQQIEGQLDGQVYQLSFDMKSRGSEGQSVAEVYWNGELIDTIDPATTGDGWQTFTFNVVGGSGDGSNTLTFVEIGSDNNGGTLIDSVAMVPDNRIAVVEEFYGAEIAPMQVFDPDVGDTHTFSLSDDRFEVVVSGDKYVLKLKDDQAFDYETETQVTVDVTVTDSGGLSDTETVVIDVLDIDENVGPVGPVIDSDNTLNSVAENGAGGEYVGITAFAEDPDSGDTVTYSITDDRFEIDPDTGVLTVKDGVSFDYEAIQSVDVEVTATSSDGSTSTGTFTVNITDVNEAPDLDFDPELGPGTSVTLTFVSEQAGYSNSLGVFYMDGNGNPIGGEIVWVNQNELTPGDTATIYLEGVEASEIGYFIIPDGADYNTLASGDEVTFQKDGDGNWQAVLNGTPLTGKDGNVFFSGDGSLNPDGYDYTVESGIRIGFEDLAGGGDEDFDDVVFDQTSQETDAHAAVYEEQFGAEVGGLSVFDPDVGDTHTFTVSDDRFEVVELNGEYVLKLKDDQKLDYETETQVTVDVTVTDAGGLSDTETIVIDVLDVDENDGPVGPVSDTDSDQNFVQENSGGGTVVGVTAFAEDPDAGDTVTYSITDDRFEIDPDTGVITVANGAVIDQETTPHIDIEVTATSSDGSTSTGTFRVEIGDENEFSIGPVTDIDGDRNFVQENSAGGTVVGVTAFASDPDAGDTVTYSITDDRFEIDPDTGVITVADGAVIDHEATPFIDIEVTATSTDGSTSSGAFRITVGDECEFSIGPVTDIDATGNSISETATGGELAGITAFATDPDASDTVTYQLSGDGRFEIDETTGVIKVADGASFDAETEPSIDLTVTATSTDGSSSSATFTVDVVDGNEAPDLIVHLENGARQFVVNGSFEIFDGPHGGGTGTGWYQNPNSIDGWTYNNVDVHEAGHNNYGATDGGHHLDLAARTNGWASQQIEGQLDGQVYHLSFDMKSRGGAGQSVAEVYWNGELIGTIDPATTGSGWQTYDFDIVGGSGDGSNTLTFVEIGSDNNGGALIDSVSIVSDNRTAVVEEFYGADIAPLSVIDPDVGDTHTFTVSDDRFEVVVSGDKYLLKLKDDQAFDYETETQVTVEVTATDQGGLSDTEIVVIDVIDIDDTNTPIGPITDTDATANMVVENAAGGTVVGITAFADDPDAGDTVTYSINDDRFDIDPDTGVITVADGAVIDYEANSHIYVDVTATSTDGSSTSKTFRIDIDDENECSIGPVTDSDNTLNSVAENGAGGEYVGITAFAEDPDSGDTVTYSITDDRFEIDPDTGVLSVKDGVSFDYEAIQSVDVEVTATSSDGSTSTGTFTVNITDVNEAPDLDFDPELGPGTSVTLTFVEEQAGYSNSLGVFYMDGNGNPIGGEIVWVNQNDLTPGDTATIYLEGVESAEIGYFIIPDGADYNALASGDQVTFQKDGNGNWQAVHNGTPLTGKDANVFFSGDGALNPNGYDYTVESGIRIGFEDIAGGGDEDFDDVVFDQTTQETDAHAAVYEEQLGAEVGTLSVFDPDVGDTHTFTVSDDRFEVVAQNGEYVLKLKDDQALDYETETQVTVDVSVTDVGGLSDTETIVIDVLDVEPEDGHSPPDLIVGDACNDHNYIKNGSFEVFESSGKESGSGDAIWYGDADVAYWKTSYTDIHSSGWEGLGTTDGDHRLDLANDKKNGKAYQKIEDLEEGDTYTLSVDIRHRGEDGDAAVEIYWSGKLIDTVVPLEQGEGWHTYTYQVVASDKYDKLEFKEVGESNYKGTQIDNVCLTDAEGIHVTENVAGAQIVELSVVDPDVGDTHTFSLTDNRFEVVEDGAGYVLKLKDGISLDYETEQSVTLDVTVTDSTGLSDTETVTIKVIDVEPEDPVNNNAPIGPVRDTDTAQNLVAATAAAGMVVGLTAFAQDADAGDTVTYAIDDDRFDIDEDTGVVTVADGAALIQGETINVTITATSSDGSESSAVFPIEVESCGTDNSPPDLIVGAAIYEPPKSGGHYDDHHDDHHGHHHDGKKGRHDHDDDDVKPHGHTDDEGGYFVPENEAGVELVQLSVVDPDVGDTHTFTVSDERFEVVSDGDNYLLKLKDDAAVDYETEQSITLDVTATDSGGLSDTETITLDVLDADENAICETGTRGGDTIVGGDFGDAIYGLGGNDILLGQGGNDSLHGGSGDDIIRGGTGDDLMVGGDGSDLFTYMLGDGHDSVYGGAGGNWIDIVDLANAPDGTALGDYGTDWSITMTEGSIEEVNALGGEITLSQDAGGYIELADGGRIDFSDLEGIQY
nr:cadherin domain-containing protein [Roseibium sp. CAU 1639]